jgi:uracil-DNA glycosylase
MQANMSKIEKPKALIFDFKLPTTWIESLKGETEKDYMKKLRSFLNQELKKSKVIFPKMDDCFKALELTPLNQVKVVIVGQDPYHGPGQAHGLSFSVEPGVRFPPSLRNIIKELHSDLGLAMPGSGSLKHWADHGVLLLNAVLTVEQGQAASHQGKGWEQFTDKIIHIINDECDHVVFILWGAYAQKKAAFVDRQRHFVIESVHPSPLSAHRGFFGTKPFSSANAYLRSKGISEVDWNLK